MAKKLNYWNTVLKDDEDADVRNIIDKAVKLGIIKESNASKYAFVKRAILSYRNLIDRLIKAKSGTSAVAKEV